MSDPQKSKGKTAPQLSSPPISNAILDVSRNSFGSRDERQLTPIGWYGAPMIDAATADRILGRRRSER